MSLRHMIANPLDNVLVQSGANLAWKHRGATFTQNIKFSPNLSKSVQFSAEKGEGSEV